MRYCVEKNTAKIIDGQDLANDELIIKNANNMGFAEDDIEILTEEEYKVRVDSLPKETPPLTLEERMTLIENLQLQQGGLI